MESGELLHCRKFPPRLKGAVYKSYVRPAILYGSEAWRLKDSEIGILRRTEIFVVREMCGVQLNHRKISTHMMFMLSVSEAICQLAMANRFRWNGIFNFIIHLHLSLKTVLLHYSKFYLTRSILFIQHLNLSC